MGIHSPPCGNTAGCLPDTHSSTGLDNNPWAAQSNNEPAPGDTLSQPLTQLGVVMCLVLTMRSKHKSATDPRKVPLSL